MKRITYILITGSLLVSCSDKVEKHYLITDFKNPIYDTLKPLEKGSYTTELIKVKGFTSDTIFVSFGGNSFKKYLSGKVDTTFISDYYGEGKTTFAFDPFKAKKGKVELSFSIE